jgi:hypothetical protein
MRGLNIIALKMIARLASRRLRQTSKGDIISTSKFSFSKQTP